MNPLERLAGAYGIEESFRDARGAMQVTLPATRRALLKAMGVVAEDEESARAALAELHAKEWQRALPSVCVVHQGRALAVPIAQPAGTASIRWQVKLEEGEEARGEAAWDTLELVATQERDGVALERRMLELPSSLPVGYHRLAITPGDKSADLIVSPGQCWLPAKLERGERLWGIAAQVYLLRSEGNWGIGDYSDLKRLVEMAVAHGADVVGVNPLHAIFPDDPEHASPYSPASRLLLNVLNIDIMAALALVDCADARERIQSESFRAALARCRERALVDYAGVAELKLPILGMLFASWRAEGDSPQWRRFADFREAQGEAFERGCVFLALREYFTTEADAPDWRSWPAEYRDPAGSAVAEFSALHGDRVTFHAWLQYLADAQLGEVAQAARQMSVGLYRDLAVGADPSGAETWSNQKEVVYEAHVGAPPDIYNPPGQNWGLPPFNPMALREEGYRSFITLLRANMRRAGALRIDHVMALQQLFWVPEGLTPAEGAYVRYPLEDLIGILALESHRHRCLVVGEDLGTVPEGFRERLSAANVLSYRVLFFEKEEGGFISPDRYPSLSLAVAGSHDLPTLRAWWTGADLSLKERLGLFPHASLASAAKLERQYDRSELLAAFKSLGLPSTPEIDLEALIGAAHAYLASSASAITMVQIDDVAAEVEPVNVPTTSSEHPNWRRRLSLTLDEISRHPRFVALSHILNQMRAAPLRAAAYAPRRSRGTGVWTATYRLQLHREFPLDAAREILPYLKGLGISHVYLSPCLQATPGSTHGYDVTDCTRVSDDLGGEEAWSRFVSAAREQDLKILLDIVPNHMAATANNAWWDDVLAHGPYSEFAGYFDIRMPPDSPFRVHLCSLARGYGEALEAGELKIELRQGALRLKHFDNSWPLSAASWESLIRPATPSAAPVAAHADCFARLAHLQAKQTPTSMEREKYRKHLGEAQSMLRAAANDGRLEPAVAGINGTVTALNEILKKQFYALHGWTLSGELTNYRRFFDVDTLVGLRTESEIVMTASHARIAAMVSRDELDGLRIDHPDGLADPRGYFRRLRERMPAGRIYVEKILANDERLEETWHVDGTVGYDFLAKVNRLWMDDSHVDALTATYTDFTGHSVNVGALVRQKQRDIIESAFFGDLNRLAVLLVNIARSDWSTSDLSPRFLREALAALTAGLPVYRTYRTGAGINAQDAQVLIDTIQNTRMAAPTIDARIFDFLKTLLTKSRLTELETEFVTKWQQLTPAVMAKGVEDTTFYVFDRLLSCNEVGASASLLGISADKFHEYCHYLSEHWPHNLLGTSTHDNKRSEDVRTRISLLSEIPERWSATLHDWSQLNADAWGNRAPDRHAEYLLYQTLIGAWPITRERCWQYMLKASREAKIHTSWHQPNPAYEDKIRGFTESVLGNSEFIESLQSFVKPLIQPGRVNSLAQTLLKMVVPGVPDFYQGTELWDLNLVDPDNRRPVDYALRGELLQACKGMSPAAALADWDSGLPKLWMIRRILEYRAKQPHDFGENSPYEPISAIGARLSNLIAFRRGQNLVAAVPRFGMSIQQDWQDTHLPLPDGQWVNIFTDQEFSATARAPQIFRDFPVALLVRKKAGSPDD